MNIKFYRPKNEQLQKYIEGYYFISEDENSKTITYWTFPNNYCILAVNYNSDVVFEEKKIMVVPSNHETIQAGLVFRYIKPLEVCYQNPTNEVTFYFKPLGLNHFMINYQELFLRQKAIAKFNPFVDFKNQMKRILKLKDRDIQIEELESYWLSKLQIRDFSFLEMIKKDLETDLKIEDIAKKHQITRQYLSKLFLRNIGKTPSEYRKIYRFRNSIVNRNKAKNLTALSYDNLFFDQSHFIKDFKKLTDKKPGLFFKI